MTLSDLTRCAMCDTPDTCGRAGRCCGSFNLGAPLPGFSLGDEPAAPAPLLPPRARILREAERVITQDRAVTHGDASENLAHLARVWSARLGITITPEQACIMLIDFKGTRAWTNPRHGDNWVDICGWGGIGGELALGAEVQP